MRFELDEVMLIPDGVHVSRITMKDGVAFLRLRQSPAIVNAEGQTVLF